MKYAKRRLLGLVTGMALCLCQAGTALSVPLPMSSTASERVLTVEGRGEIKVRPDAFFVVLGSETNQKTLSAARAEINHAVQGYTSALKTLGFRNISFQTGQARLEPVYGPQEKTHPARLIGYHGYQSLTVRVVSDSADQLGDDSSRVLDTALTEGASSVGELTFYLSDPAPFEASALALATLNAQRNANAMAEAAGVTLLGPSVISASPEDESGSFPRPYPMFARAMAAGKASPEGASVETGETTISRRVRVRYRF